MITRKLEAPKESQEQICFVNWSQYHPILKELLLYIANDGKRDPKLGNKLKRMGLRKGVSDFFLPLPTNNHHGLWIELKRREKYKISKEQSDWIRLMRHLDYRAEFAIGWDEAREITLDYLKDYHGHFCIQDIM